jgi:hypothetical protein
MIYFLSGGQCCLCVLNTGNPIVVSVRTKHNIWSGVMTIGICVSTALWRTNTRFACILGALRGSEALISEW